MALRIVLGVDDLAWRPSDGGDTRGCLSAWGRRRRRRYRQLIRSHAVIRDASLSRPPTVTALRVANPSFVSAPCPHTSAPAAKIDLPPAEPAGHHKGAGAPHSVRWQARSRRRIRARRDGRARQGRPRGDPRGGCSPRILQLSGVGAPEHLGRVGIAVHHDLPGVGQTLHDHDIARISYPVQGMATVNERSRGIPLAAEVLRYLVTGKGMLTYSASLAAASVKVLEESASLTCRAASPPAASRTVRSANSTISRA
jgi:hypothetical protein